MFFYKRMMSCIIVCLLIAGCSSKGTFQRDHSLHEDNAATIIVYRPNTYFHRADPEKPFIYINDTKLGKLGIGSNLRISVPNGKYSISVKQSLLFMPGKETNRLELVVDEHKHYYVRYSYDFSGITAGWIVTGEPDLKLVDEKIGKIRR